MLDQHPNRGAIALLRVAAPLIGLLILSSSLLLFFRHAQADTLEFEAAKALLQLGVVAVIGAGVSLLTFEYQRARQLEDHAREIRRQALQHREDLLRTFLAQATAAYARVKKARRLLRARARVRRAGVEMVLTESYDLYLDSLNDAQLELENLGRDVETSAQAFSARPLVADKLHSMESYLGEIIKEYENSGSASAGAEIPMHDLPALEEMLRRAKHSRFQPDFVQPFHDMRASIRADLFQPDLLR
jgi:hypothetical protein